MIYFNDVAKMTKRILLTCSKCNKNTQTETLNHMTNYVILLWYINEYNEFLIIDYHLSSRSNKLSCFKLL